MKKLISLLGLSLCCLAASAQPTSIGGITPGQTTREEMKTLVKKYSKNDKDDKHFAMVKLNQLADQLAYIRIRNDVVYELRMPIDYDDFGIKKGLITKYGAPSIVAGRIDEIDCKNMFGASFKRWAGKKTFLWPVKDGVQGQIEYSAGGVCAEHIYESYTLRHIATFKAIEAEEIENARTEAEKQRSKFDGAL